MVDQLVALVVNESNWPAASMGLALVAVAVLLYRRRRSALSTRNRVLGAMNLFFGVSVGTMALGHLLAVTTKLAVGTLQGSAFLFYAIGIALAAPSWWLIGHALDESQVGRRTVVLNGWLVATLLALGIHNLPLAAAGFLNIGYGLSSRRALRLAIVSAAVVVNLGMFVGSVIFLASGQSFEQFRGLE